MARNGRIDANDFGQLIRVDSAIKGAKGMAIGNKRNGQNPVRMKSVERICEMCLMAVLRAGESVAIACVFDV